ncbi:MAG: hypothetical protein KJP07_15355, partial [Desulfatitalea sp.]|nr:hypothetical protein [Desulfatitalea sp.]
SIYVCKCSIFQLFYIAGIEPHPFLMAWGAFVLIDLAQMYNEEELYWILLSKGYKTYRYLPTHFKTFYPCYNSETPRNIISIMDVFGKKHFPERYDDKKGIVFANGMFDKVKEGIAPLSAAHLKDPNIAFFNDINPTHTQGDELVCVIPATFANLKTTTKKMLMTWNTYKKAVNE